MAPEPSEDEQIHSGPPDLDLPAGLVVGEAGEAVACRLSAFAGDLHLLVWNRQPLGGREPDVYAALLHWWPRR